MKIYILLVACFSFLRSEEIFDLNRNYCVLKDPNPMTLCLIENRANIVIDLFRNCIIQIKYHQTLNELTDFICKDVESEEFAKYEKCFNPALAAEAQANPNLLGIVKKCIIKTAELHKEK